MVDQLIGQIRHVAAGTETVDRGTPLERRICAVWYWGCYTPAAFDTTKYWCVEHRVSSSR
jgi:hypothetical protein